MAEREDLTLGVVRVRQLIANSVSLDADVEAGDTGTALTTTAAELNAMSGGGLSATELGYLDGALSTQNVASKAVILNSAGKLNFPSIGSGAASASGLLMGTGTTGAPASTSTADAKFVEIRAQSTATSGDNRLAYLRYNLNGTGGGECLRAFTDLTAAVGTSHGAHISLQAGDTGYVSGLGVGIRAQLYVKNAVVPANGTYYAGQSEIYFEGSTSSIAAATKVALHSFSIAGDATNAASVKYLFDVDATANNIGNKSAALLIANADVTGGGGAAAYGLQVCVEGTPYWIPLYSI